MKKYPKIIISHSDPNINIGIRIGVSMSYPGPDISGLLASDITELARLIKRFNEELDMSHFEVELAKADNKKEFLSRIVEWMKNILPELKLTEEELISLGLRLWIGCISAAKALSDKDMNGPIDAKYRAELFSHIDAYAQEDPVFLAGVETAPKYKNLMDEPIFLEGVPSNSVVRQYI